MSALGSSVINKSGKKFAPKAPVRRVAASVSTQNSARASVDRQILSQTPQPQQAQSQKQAQLQPQPQAQSNPQSHNARHHVSVPKPVSQPAPASSQQSILEDQSASLSHGAQASTAVPSKRTQSNILPVAPEAPTPLQASPRKRILEKITSSSDHDQAHGLTRVEERPTLGLPQLAQSQNEDSESSSLSSLHRPSPTPEVLAVAASSTRPRTIAIDTVIESSDSTAPAAKRRKLQNPRPKTVISVTSQTGVNVPIPSRETDGIILEALGHEVHPGTTQSATIQQPLQTRNSRLSANTKAKERIEAAAAKVVADATRGLSSRAKKGHRVSKATSKPRKKRAGIQKNQTIENEADTIEGSPRKGKYKRRSRRSTTPEGAEEVRIVPSQTTMSDLCKNIRTGRKSTRELELEKLDEAQIKQKRQRKIQQSMRQDESSAQVPESADKRLERLARERDPEEVSREVPNTVIVDGQIQIDEASLQLDRHANAAVERDAEQLEGIDESELTRRVNQASWLKHDKSGSWNEELTNRFYDGLRMFGTDFGMISKLFPGRTRHSIKLKFSREEKLDKCKIKQTLLGERIPVDMDEYSRMSNTVYADPKDLERELDEDRKRMEREHAAEKEALEELRRQRETEAAAEAAAVVDDASDQEIQTDSQAPASSTKGKRGRKAKSGNKGRAARG